VDWDRARSLTQRAVQEWKEFSSSELASYVMEVISPKTVSPKFADYDEVIELPTSPKQAIKIWKERMDSTIDEFSIRGESPWGKKVAYWFHKEDPIWAVWYVQAVEIVLETCQWVTSQTDFDSFEYVLRWSG
jgi:hypothetical protein|tara:strand:- start:1136 stop:1531 length:396 start_codon:yes stop_codon:yes gene_type:complete